jgi:hypothetical protein
MPVLSRGRGHETARVHHHLRRSGSNMAAFGARTTAPTDAPDHRSRWPRRTGLRSAEAHQGISCWYARFGLDRRAQHSDRISICRGNLESINKYVAEVIGLTPDVIVANSTPVIAALRASKTTTPIVFAMVNDPIGQGFISNLHTRGQYHRVLIHRSQHSR